PARRAPVTGWNAKTSSGCTLERYLALVSRDPRIGVHRAGITVDWKWPIMAIASFGHGPLLHGPARQLTFTPRPGYGEHRVGAGCQAVTAIRRSNRDPGLCARDPPLSGCGRPSPRGPRCWPEPACSPLLRWARAPRPRPALRRGPAPSRRWSTRIWRCRT